MFNCGLSEYFNWWLLFNVDNFNKENKAFFRLVVIGMLL